MGKIKDPDKQDYENSGSIRCKKNSFMNIIHYKKIEYDPLFHGVLFNGIERVNKIVFYTYLFIKMYLLYLIENDQEFPNKNSYYPIINVQFVRNVMNTITYKNDTRGRKGLSNESIKSIESFYNEYYKPLLLEEDIICRDNLKALLNYEEKDIIKNIKNNISMHFMSHLRFLIKIKYGFDKKLEKIEGSKKSIGEKNSLKGEIHGTIYKIVGDIINVWDDVHQSDSKYHEDIDQYKMLFIPFKKSFDENSVPYDVKSNPLDYVIQMININLEMEKINDKIIENNKNQDKKQPLYKLFNALPLRTDIVPKYITIDTVALIDLFITKDSKKYRDNPSEFKEIIWSRFFKINSKSFRQKGYKFNYMIKTDGIACSILLEANDGTPRENLNLKYINEIPIGELLDLLDEFVFIDPGKNDLINAMKVTKNKNYKYFKYTQRERNHHTKKLKYQKIRESKANRTFIEGVNVKEIEETLMEFNPKTCVFHKFQLYVHKKIEINRSLFDYYKQTIFRKLNWNSYINTCRNEDIMLNKFGEKMGTPNQASIILGDWSKQSIKGKESTIIKKLRRILIKRGYKVFLIDEHKTSKICSHCHNYVENLKVPKRSKPLWKLVRCNSCGTIHNRDHNAPKNMKFITEEIVINNGKHLKVFSRNNPRMELNSNGHKVS